MKKVLKSLILLYVIVGVVGCGSANAKEIIIKNDFAARQLEFDGQVWRTTSFARGDGSDVIMVQSDEFHVLFMDDTQFSISDCVVTGKPEISNNGKEVIINYQLRNDIEVQYKPTAITIRYWVEDQPYIRKQVTLDMTQGQSIDRLEVERFVTASPQARGGRGEPVYIDNKWFFGVEFPAAYTRCIDGNTPKAHSGKYDLIGNYSQIFLEDRDIATDAKPGMVRMFHFPGTTRPFTEQYSKRNGFGMISKIAVCGIGTAGEPMEITMMDYLDTIRRPVRSFVHYNNWYDGDGKNLKPENFVDKVYNTFKENLSPYGVKIDAMVPDNGWQDYKSVYQVNRGHFPKGDEDLAALGQKLRDGGSGLGLWLALNNYCALDWGGKLPQYTEAKRNKWFTRFMRYYSLASPNYYQAISQRLPELIKLGKVSYIKHDFNEMCDMGPDNGSLPTDRHGHERAVEATIKLLEIEREANPGIYQNITNWIWFSPWWLQHGNNLWMLAGDSGVNRNWPQISTRKMAITYRDAHIFHAWGDPATRPLVPISHLMTHGIIYANRCRVEQDGDSLADWSDYVVMYYARGLQLKEWYITTKMMTPERWRVLGQATRWSEENVDLLANTVMVGGMAEKGQCYGYVAWKDDNGILTLRNPDRRPQTINVPFDKTVWYRGPLGSKYHAEVIYPCQMAMPQTFISGQDMKITVPAYTTMVMELKHGQAKTSELPKLKPVKIIGSKTVNGSATITVSIPDEFMTLCDLRVTSDASLPTILVDGQEIPAGRTNNGPGWKMGAYDLTKFKGQIINILFTVDGSAGIFSSEDELEIEVDLIMDRPVKMKKMDKAYTLPWALKHGFMRDSLSIFTGAVKATNKTTNKISDDQLENIKAAKLRIWHFGCDGGQYGNKMITINGVKAGVMPTKSGGDKWEETIVDLSVEVLKAIKTRCEITVANPANDKFKFKKFQLAVQTSDGHWISSTVDKRVQTASSDGWSYDEGTIFTGKISETVVVEFQK
ncbi:MAG: hypothetical protein JEZ07_09595 [Phycisphaerae bacterium]|nr:hypothetical protein [Phycisphaerae bacterium]